MGCAFALALDTKTMNRWLVRLGAGLVSTLFLHCTEAPTPPDSSIDTSGLIQDSLGIWVDTLTRESFADMPPAFRDVHQYCWECHSHRGKSPLADSARTALTMDTWSNMVAFGPERLLLSVKLGDMPPDSSRQVPKAVLSRTEAYLASWGESRSHREP
jgi:hypothetical protein